MPYPDMKQRAFSINKLSLACFSALLATPAQATEFLGLGDLPGGIFYSSAYAVSADGSVVAGEVSAGGDLTPFRWTASGGMVPLGVAGEATGISADGNTIAGSFANAGHSEAYRWTAGGGVTGLGTSGYTHSYGRAISPDGGTVVGMVAGAGTTQAFRWTAGGGMDLLGWFAGGTPQSTALGVSDNGVVVGYGGHIGGVEAFYWTPALGAITGLGYLPGGSFSIAYAVSPDGRFIAGQSEAADGKPHPVRWAQSGAAYAITDLGMLGGWTDATGTSISADGSIVVGYSQTAGDNVAFRWSSSAGMQTVRDWLAASGVNIGAWSLYEAKAISADGTTIVGYGKNPSGDEEAFLARGGMLLGMTDFASSVASLREAAMLPAKVSGAAIAADIPRLPGIMGYSASAIFRHIEGSQSDVGGAALNWRRPGLALSASIGTLSARTSDLHDGGNTRYRGWWAGAGATVDLAEALGHPAVSGLELSAALRTENLASRVDRRYLNGAAMETARGEPGVENLTALARLAWRHRLNERVSIAPHAQWLYNRSDMEAYVETGGVGAGTVSGQKNDSAQSSLGAAVSWQARPDLEMMASYSFNHLHQPDSAPVTVTVPGLGTFSAPGMHNSADWHSLGLGIEWAPKKSVRIGASISATSGSNYPENWMAGLNLHMGL